MLDKAINARVEKNNAIFLHVRTMFEASDVEKMSTQDKKNIKAINDCVDNIKKEAVTIDFKHGANKESLTKSCEEIKNKCASTPDAKVLLNVENALGNGLSKNPEVVNRLLTQRVLPTGEKLPPNAVLFMTADDEALANPEVVNNVAQHGKMLEGAMGKVLDLPQVPTSDHVTQMTQAFSEMQTEISAVERVLGNKE